MQRIAIISTGFLRNYKFFTRGALFQELRQRFKCDVYLSVWEEDGYGSNATLTYTDAAIPSAEIISEFGDTLCGLTRHSFGIWQSFFKYAPVGALLCNEPHVLEKYRSKFFCVQRAFVPPGYDAYLHIRFDIAPCAELTAAIVDALLSFNSAGKFMITSSDLCRRPGCFGDSFQICTYNHWQTLQLFFDKLYAPDYLMLDIPAIPERILEHFANEQKITRALIPITVTINRAIWGAHE